MQLFDNEHYTSNATESILELQNNRMRDRTVSKYFLFPAANNNIARAQIAYDLHDNRKLHNGHYGIKYRVGSCVDHFGNKCHSV